MRLFSFAAGVLAAALLAPAAMAAPAPAGPPMRPSAGQLRIVARIPGPDGGWDYASFDAARHRAYVAHGDVVLALDTRNDKLDPAFARGDRLHAIVPVPGSPYLVTTNSGDSSVKILDAANGALVASLKVAADPDGAIYEPFTHTVAVVNGDSGVVTLVDPARRRVVGQIEVGDKLEFPASDGKGRLYVNVASTGQVAVIDLRTRKALTRYTMQGCRRPTGLAYVEGGRLISSCGSGVAKILDAATGRQLASLKIGGFPDAVIYDPVRHLAFIPTALDGKLNVIALAGPASDTIVARTPTQIGTRTGTVDPATGRLYLPTAQYNLPVPPGQRPTTKPGTFQILVLARK